MVFSRAKGRGEPRCGIALVYGQRLDVGGVERHLLDLIEQGAGMYSWTLIGSWTDAFGREAGIRGCRMVRWQGPRRGGAAGPGDHLARLLREADVRIVHQHGPWWSAAVSRAVRRTGCSLIRTVHLPVWSLFRGGAFVRNLKLRVFQLQSRFSTRHRKTRWVFVAESVHRRYLELGLATKELSRTIPNGVQVGRSVPGEDRLRTRTALGLEDDTVAVVFTGRLSFQKGLDTLIDAVSLRRESMAPARVLLVGAGPAEAGLRHRAKRLGVEGLVAFLGERKDVPEILDASDVFVLPSRFEALSYSLLEALAAGLPAVVTDVGDSRRVVEKTGSGIVVPAGDAGALASAIAGIVRDPHVRAEFSKRALRLAEPYTLGAFWQGHERLYEEIATTAGF